jgi:RNA polymerase-binding transcription factor DksA
MATQNSKKLKKVTPSKVTNARKPVKKSPAKAKPIAKSKPAVKAAAKKKAVAPKSKAVVKAKKPLKPVKPRAKPAPAPKAKAAVKAVAPVKAPTPAVKAGKAPKSGAITTSSKPSGKVAVPIKAAAIQGSHAPKKPMTMAGSAKVKTVDKPVSSRPVVAAKPEAVMAEKNLGSKATDMTKKPNVSTDVGHSFTDPKPKTNIYTPAKHITESKKPFEKMTEKKDFKPSTMVAAAEEPHKSRYSDKELEEFDQLIDQKLIIAREQLEFYLKQLEDMAENPDNKIKGLDDGLSTLESERVSSLASRQQKLIQHLENAKIRIKNKVYGICRETGKLISKERLRAVPHATLSIEAKQAQN